SDRDLAALRAAIAGQVFVPGQAGYDQARQAWNLAVDQRPSVVVAAESAADVAQAVRHARAHRMRIAPQGTGHGAAPLEPLDGAMLLRTTRMRRGGGGPAAPPPPAPARAGGRGGVTPPAQARPAARARGAPARGAAGPRPAGGG